MPLLTKKSFFKPIHKMKSTPSSQLNKSSNFKTSQPPLIIEEHIDNIAYNNDNKSLSKKMNKPEKSLQEKNGRPNKLLLKRMESNSSSISMHLSFENAINDSEDKSDLSYRMNEPKIKEAYMQFVKRLSQSSSNEDKITSSPIVKRKTDKTYGMETSPYKTKIQKVKSLNSSKSKLPDSSQEIANVTRKHVVKNHSKTENFSDLNILHFSYDKNNISNITEKNRNKCNSIAEGKCSPLKKSKKPNITNITKGRDVLTSNKNNYPKTDILSLDSGVSLSQEVLNQKEVKDAYVQFMQSSLEYDKHMIENPSKTQNKRKNRIESSLEVSFEKSLDETKKTKKSKKRNVKKKNVSKTKDNETQSEEENLYENLTLEEKMNLIHESRNVGLYALCDICNKARYLPHIKDPLELPDKWYCAMNSDENYNKCTDPEIIMEDKEFLIDNLYNAGSIVWAKIYGYPWWPAMVEDDPDCESYFWLEETSLSPTWYHVTFFDSAKATRAWIRPSNLKPFKTNMNNSDLQTPKNNKYSSRVEAAFKQAADAIDLPLIERLRKYSFIKRYTKLSKKGLQTSGNTEKTERKSKSKPKSNLWKKAKKTKGSIGSKTPDIAYDKENPSDISVVLDNIDWMGDQNLSFNLFD